MMLKFTDVIITTKRLVLKPISHNYKSVIFEEFTPDITKYMTPVSSVNEDEVSSFIDFSIEKLKDNSNLQLVVLTADHNEFIGCAGLHNANTDTPELGIWIKKSAQGHGYGLESVTGLIHWAKDNIEYKYLGYPVEKRNYASRRIPEANGGRVYREFKHMKSDGFELDEVEYRIYK